MLRKRFLTGLSLFAILYAAASFAEVSSVEVLALFKDKAVVRLDGRQYTLSKGQTSPEGVRLIGADSAKATLTVNGEQRDYPLGAKIRAFNKQAESQQVQVFSDRMGMFRTVGSINGLPVNFLIDTGATSIAMNDAQARRLGIDYKLRGEPAYVMTASRPEPVFMVMLDTVKVGTIELRNVQAAVLEGPQPQELLLGMSFLGRLEMQNNGQQLTLKKKF